MAIALTSGMRQNLIALQNVDSLMETTQNRLSTGKKVNSALDDPVNFFKAEDHYNRASDLAAKKDGMAEAIKTIEAANTGIESIEDLLDQMKSLASAAKTSTNTSDLSEQYDMLISQVYYMAEDSNNGGRNLLEGARLSVEFNEDGSNTLSVSGFTVTSGSITGSGTGATPVSLDTSNFSTNTTIEASISQIDAAISLLRTESQKLSSSLSTIQIRADFTSEMESTLETGADDLTLADMNEEGANMLMLQTRQNLGTTSLSLASQAAQAVLQLF